MPPKEEKEHKKENQLENEENEDKLEHNNIESKEKENEDKLELPPLPFELYRDENIIAYLKENSQVKGEIVLRPFSSKTLKELSETEISYITIFSKVFAQVLFEITKAQGTNIIWNYNNSTIHIIPRFENDKINLNWELKSQKEEFLEQIKNRLTQTMQKEIDKDEKQENQLSQDLKENEIKERAEHVIESVRRMP